MTDKWTIYPDPNLRASWESVQGFRRDYRCPRPVQDVIIHITWLLFSGSWGRWCGYTLSQGEQGPELLLFPGLWAVIQRVAALVRQWALWVLNPAPRHSVQQVDASSAEELSWDICSFAQTLAFTIEKKQNKNKTWLNGIITFQYYTKY